MATFPTNKRLVPKSIDFVAKTQAQSFQSPFCGQLQVFKYSGQWWELGLSFAPLLQDDAMELMAFINSLNGMSGTFTFSIPSKFAASSVSSPLTITGDGNTFTGGTGTVGKFVYANNRLIQFTTTSSLFPRQPLGSTSFATSGGGSFRLASNDSSFTLNEMIIGEFTVPIREAI